MTDMDQRSVTPQYNVAELRDEIREFLKRIDDTAMEAGLHRELPLSARQVLGQHLMRARESLQQAYVTVAPWPRLAGPEA